MENNVLQKAITKEFTATLGNQSAYSVVDSRVQAEALICKPSVSGQVAHQAAPP